ncbi:hypothetical protein IV203_016554 [Nitzschia inconspicua]|uniref:Uncharacterized protein n=1 Tax=Nitzschia inconspicua TaxID=303405 RepID=A0A9K3PK25_9STRA|nr:hypothetical protein IV203_016554 [Nitzschia inconspicua]
MVIPEGGNADNLQLVGLLSDRINGNIAARHDRENPLDGFVVSIASIARIRENSFVALENVTPDAVHKTSTNSNDELGFPGAMDDDLPAFVLLPEMMPVPLGYSLPISAKISNGVPPPPAGKAWWPPLPFWMEAMHYLFKHNGGKPVTTPTNNLLFTGNGVVLDEVHNWEKRCAKGSIHVEMVPLHPEHSLLTSTWPVISTKQDQKLLTWYNKTKLTAEELAASGSPLPAAGNPGSHFDLTKELISHLSSATKSAKDGSNKDLIQNSIHLRQTNGSVETKLASALHFHIEQQRKEGTLAAMASKWTKEQLYVLFANAIAEFTVLNDSIVSESSSFGYKITVFCFLVVLVTNFHFQKRVTGEQFANRQDLHVELDRNKAKKTTELFVMGEQKSIDDVVHALFNMMCFLTFVNTNCDKSNLHSFLYDLVKLLTHGPMQNWFTRQTATAKCVPHNVLVTIQDAIAGFFAFASNWRTFCL